MKISPPFGIDLGTTRTVAAAFLPDSAEPQVATDEDGRTTLPSIVRSAGEGRWRVGWDALEDHHDAPLIESVKRLMGSDETISAAQDQSPEEISAMIVTAIADRMRHHLSRQYDDLDLLARDAVITVPAYFDAPQIEATRRAGQQAGLRVGGLVQEPTAAAIYHSWNQGLGDGIYLVYDLGGGTFDVSIIRSIYGEYQVLSIDGDNHLGGDDFDRRLADHLRSHLIDAGADLSEDVDTDVDLIAFEALRRVARDAKERLSDDSRIDIDEPALFEDRAGDPVDVQLTVSRDDFDAVVDDLVESTILACRRGVDTAMDRHDIEPTDIDGVFLVGGSTRVPLVRKRLAETIADDFDIGDDAIIGDEPETSVARGAALHAAAVCPCRFDSDDVTVSITDFPSDNPDRHLIGHVDVGGDVSPAEIAFGAGDHTRTTALEGRTEPLRFSIDGIRGTDLDPVDSPLVTTVLRRGGADVRGPFQLWIPDRPEGAKPAPALALTNPAVLAKDINVEVVEQGKPARYTLVESGAHLPTTVNRRLVTGDESGALVLRLFQHRLPIHTIAIPLPENTEPGTPIELTVDIDQAMNITASGVVDTRSFEADIDRPAAPRRREWEEIEALIDRIDGVADRLWGAEKRRFQRHSDNIKTGIRAALRHDPRRLQVLARRLHALLEDYAPGPGRTPGKRRVDQLLETIRRLVFAADDERLGRTLDEWRHKLDELASDVDAAWAGDDDGAWRDVADRVQALYESVAQDEFMFRRRNPKLYARTLYDTTADRLSTLESDLKQFNFASDPEAGKLQRGEIRRIRDNLSDYRRRLPDSTPSADDVSQLEKLARSVTHLERRLDRVRTLGVPRADEPSGGDE